MSKLENKNKNKIHFCKLVHKDRILKVFSWGVLAWVLTQKLKLSPKLTPHYREMKWWLNWLSSAYDSWDRLLQTLVTLISGRTGYWKWMDRWNSSSFIKTLNSRTSHVNKCCKFSWTVMESGQWQLEFWWMSFVAKTKNANSVFRKAKEN